MDNFILFIYNFILHSVFLAALPFITAALPFVKRFRQGFWNYFGLPGRAQREFIARVRERGGRVYMIHGVSVGEIKLAGPVMEEILKRDPSAYFVLSSTSPDSFGAAGKIEPCERVSPFYFPLDIPVFISLFFRCVSPVEIYILEVDLWPNFIIAAACRKVPLYLLNGRISDKTYNFYSRMPAFSRSLFSLIDICFMQSEADRDRVLSLGAQEGRAVAAGNMKFDTAVSAAAPVKIAELKDFIAAAFGGAAYDVTLCAGSTHPDEESMIFDAAAAAMGLISTGGKTGRALLMIAPRKTERAKDIFEMISRKAPLNKVAVFDGAGGPSAGSEFREQPGLASGGPGTIDVLIIAAMGYLTAAYSFADAAFVGGTLSSADIGGHNIIEPAAFAIPVIFGKNVRNFRDAAAALRKSPNVFMAAGARELNEAVAAVFDPDKKAELEYASRLLLEIISANSCVTKKIFSVINNFKDYENEQ
jgi:3-deoxy-D-manno-octulosonic-acid transferase